MKLISYVQPVICRSLDHDIIIAFPPFRRKPHCTYRYRYDCNLVKNLPTQWKETGQENRTDHSMKKPLKQGLKTKGKTDRLIDEKPPNPVETE